MFIFERFNSPLELVKALEKRENNGYVGHASDTGTEEFTGTATWKIAEDLLIHGDSNITVELTKAMSKVKTTVAINKVKITPDYYGASPIVARALTGHPKAMRRRTANPVKQAATAIYYDNGANCDIKASDLLRAGKAILELVYRLEAGGTRVELNICNFTANCRNTTQDKACCCTLVKRASEPLDIRKMAFPIAHPSYFRRIGFRWLERCDKIKSSVSCYGGHLTSSEFKSLLEAQRINNAVIISFENVKNFGYNAEAIKNKYFS